MLKEGHFGLGLTIYLPIGAVLVAIGHFELFVTGLVAVSLGALWPDIDTNTPLFKHRGWTHTVWFMVILGVIGGAATLFIDWYLLTPERLPFGLRVEIGVLTAGIVGGMLSLGVFSHLLGDLITPRGVRPFDPVSPRGIVPLTISERKFTLELTKASNTVANWVFVIVGAFGIFLISARF